MAKTVQDIAIEHGVDISVIKEQIIMGAMSEEQNSDSHAAAVKTAMDNLTKDPMYYSKFKTQGF